MNGEKNEINQKPKLYEINVKRAQIIQMWRARNMGWKKNILKKTLTISLTFTYKARIIHGPSSRNACAQSEE